MNNKNFLVGEFRPVKKGSVDRGTDCDWLGVKYHDSIDKKPFTVKIVVQGLMEHQRVWTSLQIQ